jgi:NTP pyrophosphatase (non-canonical NTP hydrolase)
LTNAEFQSGVMRTVSSVNQDLVQACLGLADEVGELAGAVKKNRAQGHPLDMNNIKEELGDILFYVSMACSVSGFTLDEVMEHNAAKLKARYPNGFEADLSLNRIKLDMLFSTDYEALKELTTTDGINTGMLVHDPEVRQRYLDSGVAAECGVFHICRSELFMQTQNEVLEYVWRLT